MATPLELDDEPSEGWALEDSDGDAAYEDKPMVRFRLFYAPVKKRTFLD